MTVVREILLITAHDELAEQVTRLAAVAAREPRHVRDPLDAAESWRSAALILLDEALATAVIAAGFSRRPGVVLICSAPHEEFWRHAFEVGADAAMALPADEARLVELLSHGSGAPADVGRVLAVIGGSGGAGASVLASATALAAGRRGDRCLLVDCDPLGGGLDLTLGMESVPGLRWSGLAVSGGRLAGQALHDALPQQQAGPGNITVLACDRDQDSSGLTEQAVPAVIDAGRRAGDTVICDLPRAVNGCVTAVLCHADVTIVVVPAEVRACAAAARIVCALREVAGPIYGVIRGPSPGGLRAADVEHITGLPVLSAMRPVPGLPAAIDQGAFASRREVSRSSLSRCALDVLGKLDDPVRHIPELVGA